MKEYLRIIRKCKKNTRIELPDHTEIVIPTESLSLWKPVGSSPLVDIVKAYELSKEGIELNKKPVKQKKEPKPKVFTNKGTWAFRKTTNGLGVAHPYETVNMLYTPVIYEGDIEAPF